MAAVDVVGAICGHGANLLILRDMVQHGWQDGIVAFSAWGRFHRAGVGNGCGHGQMDLGLLAPPLNFMLARLSFAIAEELDAEAVHQQVKRPANKAIRDLYLQSLPPAAMGRAVRNGPVQPRENTSRDKLLHDKPSPLFNNNCLIKFGYMQLR